MKILMLTPYLPYPPHSGGQVRSYNLLKNLVGKHQITLFSLIKNPEERKYVTKLKELGIKVKLFERPAHPWNLKNIFRTGFSLYPFLVIRNFSNEEKKILKKELKLKKYDLIHAENFYVMPHLPKTSTPVLLTEQTVFYRVYQHFMETLPWYFFWLKPLLMIDVWKLKQCEAYYWQKSDFLAAVSRDDLKYIKTVVADKKIHIISNGVDFDYFDCRLYQKDKQPTVLFGAADFHWMQNKEGVRLLLEKIWPLLKKRVPRAKLWIVGKIAPRALSDYKGQEDVVIEEIKDTREAYQRAWVLLAPMRSGGGSRTKFFEAMASGLPIVTTPEGIEGIPAQNGKEIVVENRLDLLAERTIRLLSDLKMAEKIGLAGKKLVQKNYDWSRSAEKLDRLYREISHAKKN